MSALDTLLRPTVVEVGKIKIGGLGAERTAANGNKYRVPVKLDHFIVTTMHRDGSDQMVPDAELMEALREHADADGKIRRLPILLMSDHVEDVLATRYVAYAGKRTVAKSDGDTAILYQDRPGGAWLPTPRTVPFTEDLIKTWNLKLATVLSCQIASAGSRWGGVYKFRTTSRISAEQLLGSLRRVKQLTLGALANVPLTLTVRPMQVAPDGKPTTIYVVHVELAGTDLKAIRADAMDRMRYELANVKEVRALQGQLRALMAHDEPDENDITPYLAPGEIVTPDGEIIAADAAPSTPVPPPTTTPTEAQSASAEAVRLAGNKLAFAAAIQAKGWEWPQCVEFVNKDWEQQYTNAVKFFDLTGPERLGLCEHIVSLPAVGKL